MSLLNDILRSLTGGGNSQSRMPRQAPAAPQRVQAQPMRAPAQFQGPQEPIKYPRSNPDSGFYQAAAEAPVMWRKPMAGPGPAPRRAQGLPANFFDAPQLPTHDPELYDEVLRIGGFNMPRF